MARELKSRLKIEGTLLAETPLHVGGYGESFETDMALAKNGNDEFYIPGTSLTGALRNWFEDAFGENEMEELFGKKQAEFASFVLIEDLRLPEDLRDSLQSELRDGVGIDRHYGTAANQAKFDRAILPKGTELKFEICVEIGINKDADKIRAMFGHLLESLQKGEIRIGASKTRGLGKVVLEKTKIKEDKLLGLDILELLKAKEAQEKRFVDFDKFKADFEDETKSIYKKLNSEIEKTSQKLTIDIIWQPKSPLMVKASYDGIGVDTLPLTSSNGKDKVSLVLPGSSTKGVFRSHAERILRTLLDIEAPKKFDNSQNFSNQVRLLDKNGKDTEKATKLIGELFGAKKEKEDKNKPKSTLGLGALSIDDCFAKKQMNAATWQDVEVGEFKDDKNYNDTILHQSLRKIDLDKSSLSDDEKRVSTKDFHISHHTAIDRFTGAASDGALFSVLKPSNTTIWDKLKLTLDLKRISNDKAALMLLLLVLRDFAENRLPLGFATNRGMGEVKVKSIKLKGKILEQFGLADEITLIEGKASDLDPTFRSNLAEEWKEWKDKNQTLQS